MKKLILLSLFFALSSGINALTTEKIFEQGYHKYLASHSKLSVKSVHPMTIGKKKYNVGTILGLGTGAFLTGALSLSGFSTWLSKNPKNSDGTTLTQDDIHANKIMTIICLLAAGGFSYALSKYYSNYDFTISAQGILIPKYGLIKWTSLEKVTCSTADATSTSYVTSNFFDGTYHTKSYTAASTRVTFTLKSGLTIKWNELPTDMAQDMFDFFNHMIDGIKAQS